MKMANTRASVLLLFTIALKITNTEGELVEGKAKPAQYISFPPSAYMERSYNVTHPVGGCTLSTERVDDRDDEIVNNCPYGELLMDEITQANLEDNVTNSDIKTFYTWEDRSIRTDKAFITLQFPSNTITPTRVVVYCLDLMELQAREPKGIKLYSSTTESVYPDEEIQDVNDNKVTVVRSGTTPEGDDYEYKKIDLIIPEDERVSLNYLRISLEFDGMNWMFISEVEVYHMVEASLVPNTTTLMQTPTPSTMATSLSSSFMVLTTTTSASFSVKTSLPTPLDAHTPSTPSNTFQTPVFLFPTVNPLVLHIKTLLLDVPINCTVTWEGNLSQLTTMWFYNGTMITNSQKYGVTEGHLIIKKFTPEDVGMYVCYIKHSSGWNDSRQYLISINPEGSTVQEPEDGSKKDLPILIIIGATVGSIGLILFCLIVIICVIVCHRKNKKQQLKSDERNSYLNTEKSDSILHTYANEFPSDERKQHTMESGYAHVEITDSLPIQTSIKSNPPTIPRLPKKFRYSKKIPVPELPKLQEEYAFLGNYIKLETIPSLLEVKEITETYFDIYDDTVNVAPKSILHSPQDIYCEAFDYNHHVQMGDDNTLSMCVPIYDDPRPLRETEAPKYVEWRNVAVVAKIGEGQFGDVYLAETYNISSTVDLGHIESKSLAAIKTLKGDYSEFMKEEFEKEIKFMSRLNNANVIRLLGICNKGTPFMMMEYMSNGDLHMFLGKHYLPEIGKDTAEALIPIDSIILQYVALQIANGMRYLASFGFIHRDLAARNCLVGEDYIVKIADFGMTQDLYNEAYFIMRGKAIVPIRWMAPESFFGKFSTKTDVWSYGVTLWEIFTLCRKQPYHEMTDEELIIDVQKERNRTIPKRPLYIPNEVNNVMNACWMYNSHQRPDFESIYNRLFDFYMQHNQQ